MVLMKKQAVFACAALMFFSLSSELFSSVSESFSSEIEWKLFLTSPSNHLLTTTTSSGEPFVINTDDISANTPGSEELIDALDGISFFTTVSGPLSIHITLNVQGNRFKSANGKNVCINFNVEVFVNGTEVDSQNFFRNSLLVMTIPRGEGLYYLLKLENFNLGDIRFVYCTDGKFENDGIDTNLNSSEIVVNIIHGATVVAGINTDFGFPASVDHSTWYKVKKLFE